VSARLSDRSPFGAIERLDHDALVREQRTSAESPRRTYSLSARTTPFTSRFDPDFGSYDSLADLFRQIGYDERLHKEESEAHLGNARFR